MRFTASMGVFALILSLLVPAAAQVDMAEDPAPEKVDYDAISAELDLELKMLIFSLGKEGEEDLLPVCTVADITEVPELTTAVAGCHVVSIAGPNGQVNHGSIVSAMAHYSGPGKGKLMRQVAKWDLGKGDDQVKADGGADSDGAEAEEVEEADSDEAKPEGWIPPGQAKKKGN
jgi:hypothetical protein